MIKDLSVLRESPFTDQGSVVGIFTDLTVWRGIRKVIEMMNANAAAEWKEARYKNNGGDIVTTGRFYRLHWGMKKSEK